MCFHLRLAVRKVATYHMLTLHAPRETASLGAPFLFWTRRDMLARSGVRVRVNGLAG